MEWQSVNQSFPMRRLALTIAIGLAAIVIAFLGWRQNNFPVDDALYRSVQVLTLSDIYSNSGSAESCLAVNRTFGARDQCTGYDEMRLARILGAIFFAMVVFGAAQVILQHAWIRFRSWRRKHNIVIAGDGYLAKTAFQNDAVKKRTHLWLGAPSLEKSGRSISQPWPTGAELGDAIRKRTRGSASVLIADEDDSRALALTRALTEDPRRKKANLTTVLYNARAAEEAASWINEASDRAPVRLLSFGRLAARALFEEHPPFILAETFSHAQIHALVVGFGTIGEALARDIMINCQTVSLDKPHITVIDPKAAEKENILRLQAPELDEVCVLRSLVGGFGGGFGPPKHLEASAPPITATYICVGTDAEAWEALNETLAWLRQMGRSPGAVFLRMGYTEDGDLQPRTNTSLPGISLVRFGGLADILAQSAFLGKNPDRVASSFHVAHQREVEPDRMQDANDPISRTWNETDETTRQSNRAAAEHLPAKLASMGYDMRLLERNKDGVPQLPDQTDLYVSSDDLDALAALEHKRWMAERRLAGWQYGETKDKYFKHHPDLVPYEELSDGSKGYDRSMIKTANRVLGGRTAKSN